MFFFFSSRRRHTRLQGDWSSDVCSSDLSETIPVDVRLIAATNRDLKEAIKQGRFREDLYYRLAVVTIRLPTLVERGDDLVLLTAYYVRLFAQRYGKKIQAISDPALGLLRAHAWVGNVREL